MLGCADVFPNLKGVAEDPLHLALRIERCFSGKRVAVSRLVLDLHRKFRAPHETEICTGEEPAMGVEGIWTNVVHTEITHFVLIGTIIAQRHSDGIKNTLTS